MINLTRPPICPHILPPIHMHPRNCHLPGMFFPKYIVGPIRKSNLFDDLYCLKGFCGVYESVAKCGSIWVIPLEFSNIFIFDMHAVHYRLALTRVVGAVRDINVKSYHI